MKHNRLFKPALGLLVAAGVCLPLAVLAEEQSTTQAPSIQSQEPAIQPGEGQGLQPEQFQPERFEEGARGPVRTMDSTSRTKAWEPSPSQYGEFGFYDEMSDLATAARIDEGARGPVRTMDSTSRTMAWEPSPSQYGEYGFYDEMSELATAARRR